MILGDINNKDQNEVIHKIPVSTLNCTHILHGKFKNEELVNYLIDNGVPSSQIADLPEMAMYEIRNILKD